MSRPPTSTKSSLRSEHREITRRRIVTAARRVFETRGYYKATIEDIRSAADISRATLYLHFDSKLDVLHAAAADMAAESNDAARRLAIVLIDGDRSDLRAWVEWALAFYVRNRPIALAVQEAELSQGKPTSGLRTYLECLDPWVATWPAPQRVEATMRFELCRLQMHHYMWGPSPAMFNDEQLPIDLFTEIWWNTLKTPVAGLR